MKVIVTGGTGLIGSALSESLHRDGHEVVVLSRYPDRKADRVQGPRVIGWDSATGDGWYQEASGADAIVNLAGASLSGGRWTDSRKRLIRESRVKAGQAVVDACRRAETPPKAVIQSSGLDYYGDRDSAIITEEADRGSSFLADVTEDWEASTAAVEDLGVRRAIMRTGIVLSSDGGALQLWALPFRLFVGGPAGNGQQWVAWIHRTDTVRAIRFLIEHPDASGPYNVTAPNPVRNETFSRVMADVLNRPAVFKAPAFALRLALGEMADVILQGRRAVPARLQSAGFEFEYPELKPALRDALD